MVGLRRTSRSELGRYAVDACGMAFGAAFGTEGVCSPGGVLPGRDESDNDRTPLLTCDMRFAGVREISLPLLPPAKGDIGPAEPEPFALGALPAVAGGSAEDAVYMN